MSQNLDLKEISEGSLILRKDLPHRGYFLVLEYDFYLDAKGKTNHIFITLSADKIISWYSSHDLEDIINITGDYNE
tara:strand:+ start:21 stop:248 length:228 start_codon:yes stop_codon:yes gene_type:complete